MIVFGAGVDRAVAFGTLAAIATGITAFLWYRNRNKPPTRWIKVGKVTALYLYPVKSCKGLAASELEVVPTGFKLNGISDRMFVVINAAGDVVTGRDYPKLTQVCVSVPSRGKIRIDENGIEGIEIDTRTLRRNPQKVNIWGLEAEGIDCGDMAAKWLSHFILNAESGLRLLCYANTDIPKDPNPKISRIASTEYRKKDAALFSDAVAFHLISEISVTELNSHLHDEEVSPRTFRPNIVVAGAGMRPFDEDSWTWVKIGDVVFRYLSPCSRCLFTTVSPTTGRKYEKHEPLATLRKYRFPENPKHRAVLESPIMGIYLAARSEGIVAVGQDVMIPWSLWE